MIKQFVKRKNRKPEKFLARQVAFADDLNGVAEADSGLVGLVVRTNVFCNNQQHDSSYA